MYIDDQSRVAAYAAQSDAAYAKTVMMVVVSVRQRWERVGVELADITAHGADSLYCWGHRRKALEWLSYNAATLRRTTDDYATPDLTPLLIRQFAQVPGVGIAKAGFCSQLIYGLGGCIDCHNAKRLGLDMRAFERPKQMPEDALADRCRLYVSSLKLLGGSAYLWDSWCEHLAAMYPAIYAGPEDASERHWRYLEGE